MVASVRKRRKLRRLEKKRRRPKIMCHATRKGWKNWKDPSQNFKSMGIAYNANAMIKQFNRRNLERIHAVAIERARIASRKKLKTKLKKQFTSIQSKMGKKWKKRLKRVSLNLKSIENDEKMDKSNRKLNLKETDISMEKSQFNPDANRFHLLPDTPLKKRMQVALHAHPHPILKKMPTHIWEYLQRLIRTHGRDWRAMGNDLRLNYLQFTVGKIKREALRHATLFEWPSGDQKKVIL